MSLCSCWPVLLNDSQESIRKANHLMNHSSVAIARAEFPLGNFQPWSFTRIMTGNHMEGWTRGALGLLIGPPTFHSRARLVNPNVTHRAPWTLKFETFRKGGVRLQTLWRDIMDSFSTKNLALQAQKKLMSKMATKTVANLFIDDTSSEVLDELYRVTKEYTRNRKEAQKIIKNLIKMVVKLGVLYRNGQFNNEELALVERFRKKVHTLAMTAVSFYQIDFTFDRRVMSNLLNDCRELLHQAINRHLTAKSHGRINHVFNHFSDCEFLATLYGPSEVYRSHLQKICEGVNKMLDDGNL
ncbi:hypothetical protein QQF64_019909 [Cirrhinus molitorella]|uniref:Tumor necrosis factor alpha-induced protein 8-like protein 1 n=1 Tax=Cirrhinus molitorella TaxID=172907 RepID=A0ABR3LH00_9TELE